jgi:DNA-binding MarR family transcriptional regulator
MGKLTELGRKLSKEKWMRKAERLNARKTAYKIDQEIKEEKRIRKEKAYEETSKAFEEKIRVDSEISNEKDSLDLISNEEVSLDSETSNEKDSLVSDLRKVRARLNNKFILKRAILNLVPITYSDITKILNIDFDTCYYIVGILFKEGLITKSRFSRTILVEITDEGIEYLQKNTDEEEKNYKHEINRIKRFINKHNNNDDPESLFNNTKLIKKIMMGCVLSEEEKKDEEEEGE